MSPQFLDSDAIDLVIFIMNCEGGGMAISRITPRQMMKETVFYFNVRSIILSEQRKISNYKEKERKRKEGRGTR